MKNTKSPLFIIIIFYCLLNVSCDNTSRPNETKEIDESELPDVSIPTMGNSIEIDSSVYNSKYLDKNNVLINGNSVILPYQTFDSLYKKQIDSSKKWVWECGSPFEWLDEKWMIETYGSRDNESYIFEKFDGNITTIYGRDIEFSTNNHIVLFDQAFTTHNSLTIVSHNIVLDKNMTLSQFKKIFPNAELEENDQKEGEVRFRFYLNANSEDAFLFYFKNNKLNYFTLWWLLC